jgi:hypothetical protein
MAKIKFKPTELQWKVMSGELEHPENVGLSKIFLGDTNIQKEKLKPGELALKTDEDDSEIYRVIGVTDKKIIVFSTRHKIEYNDIMRKYRRNLTPEKIKNDYWIDPKESAINIVPL